MAFDNTRAPVKWGRSLVWILVMAFVSACASGPKKPPVGTLEPDKFLWERGTDELNKKHWLTAREYFRQLMDSYPQSTYRADAKLGLADTYLGEGSAESDVLAVNEYREFLSFYPTHERAYYAQFKLGMCHFYQMHGPDRDQTETHARCIGLIPGEFAPEGRILQRGSDDEQDQARRRHPHSPQGSQCKRGSNQEHRPACISRVPHETVWT